MAKQFDYSGAKSAGYSDEEISQHLSKNNPSFDVHSALKSGYSPKEVSDFINEKNLPEKGTSLAHAGAKGLIKGGRQFNPIPHGSPISNELAGNLMERFLPTRKGNAEDIVEFTAENLPLAFMGEGGLIKKGLSALTGSLSKKGAKEINLPEWAQEIAGGLGMAAPGIGQAAASKALRPSSSQNSIVDFLKSKGLSDKDITPIMQDKKMLSFLSKAALKYEKKEPWIRGIKNQIGNIFDDIRTKGRNSTFSSNNDLINFENEFNQKLNKLPRRHRKLIQKEVDDLMNNPVDFTELHDFYKAVNDIVKDVEGGKASIGILKEPVERAQLKMNPDLYKELKMTNESYSRLSDFTDKMTKKNWDSLLNLGQAGGALWGLLTMNPALLTKTGVVGATRFTAKQMLSNPRLQNIHLKMWDAFLKNDIPLSLKLSNLMKDETEKALKNKKSKE